MHAHINSPFKFKITISGSELAINFCIIYSVNVAEIHKPQAYSTQEKHKASSAGDV